MSIKVVGDKTHYFKFNLQFKINMPCPLQKSWVHTVLATANMLTPNNTFVNVDGA